METTTNIVIRTQFPAIHSWPTCDIYEVNYLRNPHRHVFHVEMKWQVGHDDRDIEFIKMKSEVDEMIRTSFWNKNLGSMSCEMIARNLKQTFNASYVSVFEDGENGAEIYNTN